MVDLIGLWSHALAALLYAGLALWQWRRWSLDIRHRPLVTAFAACSLWALFEATAGPGDRGSHLLESARNLALLVFMYGIVHHAADDARQRGVKLVYGAAAAVVLLQAVVASLIPRFPEDGALTAAWSMTGAAGAAGCLVLVHNLYTQASRTSRRSIRLPVIALGGMWAYDLHLYTVALLTGNAFDDLFAFRGVAAVMLAPLFAVATRRTADWGVQLSRAAAFQTLSIFLIAGYFLAMISATRALETLRAGWVQPVQVGLILGMSIAALILLPSPKTRSWIRVFIAKHLFEHRYDYREDWLRFTRAIGRPGEDGGPIEERIVKALADIAGSDRGLLLTLGPDFRLTPSAHWNWPVAEHSSVEAGADFVRFMESASFVLDFGALKSGRIRRKGYDTAVPQVLARLDHAWAGIPLIHGESLLGLVVLGHPTARRPMDWEDYDLFRTAGRQAASYLAEARSQQALGEARRFDEFNRRFAFVMHDIKNLVSQLSLVARNAERHADNPEFRADMVVTLQSSVRKMNDLLARLAGGSGAAAEAPQPLPLRPVLAALAEANSRRHPVLLTPGPDPRVLADEARLEQALGHLVQNAIEASPPDVPVRIRCTEDPEEVRIEIADSGHGMSQDFVRTRLFQPFASTKEGGFGIGAFEARTLVEALGGRIEVESREGQGSRFTLSLPSAAAEAEPQRRRA